ncbi:MAG: metal ABC transporter permease [Puniceicoccales bacterium]|jgi:ABC-type Mn2+/Zn2+ transport system permease subunit|nr:metal ABC transporter permease [Puniceicoccales bacterium]
MISLLLEFFSDGFLLKHAFRATILLGTVAPLAGCFLLLRRATFLGVALPQVSAAGMSAGWLLLEAGGQCTAAAAASGQGGAWSSVFSLLCALLATLCALLVLAWLEQRSGGAADSRHGALYALAGAATILLLAYHPHAESIFAGLLRGEIVAAGPGELRLVVVVLLPAAVVLALFRHEFLWAGADPGFMAAAGRNVLLWNSLLLGVTGAIICAAVYITGPLVCLGVMLLPALAAHGIAGSMRTFFVLAPLLGLLGAMAGFTVAYLKDLPTGMTIVAAHGVVLVLTKLAGGLLRRKKAKRNTGLDA